MEAMSETSRKIVELVASKLAALDELHDLDQMKVGALLQEMVAGLFEKVERLNVEDLDFACEAVDGDPRELIGRDASSVLYAMMRLINANVEDARLTKLSVDLHKPLSWLLSIE
jgi:hypothetical protein